MGVDGISILFVMLTTFLMPIDHRGVLGRRAPGEGIHGRLPAAGDADARRLHGARSGALLPVLRGGADPDVPDHRHLGRQGAHLRLVQVLPLHLPRLDPDACRDDRDVCGRGHDGHSRAAAPQVRRRADQVMGFQIAGGMQTLAVARLLRQLRGQDADVAGPHVVARRPRSGADRGLGRAGGDPAQDGRLRLPALLAPDVPGRLRPHRRPSCCGCRSSPSSTPRSWRWCSRT